jgi:hypothetical protein
VGTAKKVQNLARVENQFVVISETTHVPVYDFDFDLHFRCTHPQQFDHETACILRTGAIHDYDGEFREKAGWGLRIVNSPVEHLCASDIEIWYPKLADITPRTRVFAELPGAAEIEACFGWPIFLKGSRQTSQHNPDLSVITSAAQYQDVSRAYACDPILHWQRPAIREFVRLMPVSGAVPGKVRPSLEFRSFWWKGQCVGWGEYWYQVPRYGAKDVDRGLSLAEDAAKRLQVPFLVVDFAKTLDGRWIVIECNDAQESGYAAIRAANLWRNVLECFGK